MIYLQFLLTKVFLLFVLKLFTENDSFIPLNLFLFWVSSQDLDSLSKKIHWNQLLRKRGIIFFDYCKYPVPN